MLRVYPLHSDVGYVVGPRVSSNSNESISMISHMRPVSSLGTGTFFTFECCWVMTGASVAFVEIVTSCAPAIGAASFFVRALLVLRRANFMKGRQLKDEYYSRLLEVIQHI
jgi:hypothetical protein